ncbi:cuticle protein 16.5-like [Ochlerotatus camptorhynchus]|uniref:cuticle protein 16.5-like n=1 Tax=Ochlerotatus camptorhynchus TaxID=644619 RepID=UPI0031E28AE4
MVFKLAVLFATLAYVSAGAIESIYPGSYVSPVVAHYAAAPAVSFSSITQTHPPSVAYSAPSYGYAHSHGYAAPALSYTRNYAPELSYATSLSAYKHAVNPIIDARTFDYGYSTPEFYSNYGHFAH